MRKVILDTDIGIDDAMALLFLHYAPGIEIEAIVSGIGNASVETTTRNAIYIKERFGIGAPVFMGAEGPMGPRVGNGYPDFVHGSNGLGEIELPDVQGRQEAGEGAAAIVDIVRRNPRDISIVAVGRQSNLARALELEPDLPALVKNVVVMGGAFGYNGHHGNVTPVAEANIAGDPLAADRVFSAGFDLTIVGLDVTQETIADDAFFRELRDTAGDAGQFIFDISRYYLAFHERTRGSKACPVHDSSAVACLLQPGLFDTIAADVSVTTDGEAMGQTVYRLSESSQTRICTAVDAAGLLALYIGTLGVAGN